jgi:hypothetical protein
MGGWAAIGAEETATGYQVAWKLAGQDQYSVWNTDGGGNYVSNAIGVASGASSILKSLETSFRQDLNGDGTVGVAAKTVDSTGWTDLLQGASALASKDMFIFDAHVAEIIDEGYLAADKLPSWFDPAVRVISPTFGEYSSIIAELPHHELAFHELRAGFILTS